MKDCIRNYRTTIAGMMLFILAGYMTYKGQPGHEIVGIIIAACGLIMAKDGVVSNSPIPVPPNEFDNGKNRNEEQQTGTTHLPG